MNKTLRKILHALATVFFALFTALGFLLLFSATWFVRNFNQDIGLDSVIFTVFSDMNGADSGLVNSFLLESLLPTVLFALILTAILILSVAIVRAWKKAPTKIPAVIRITALVLSALFLLCSFLYTGNMIGLFEYLESRKNSTELFDKYYVSPADVSIEFPEQKRNLIYIYLESVEISFLDEKNAGALPKNLMPNLTQLAMNHLNFSHTDGVGGGQTTSGSTWTIGAMVSQSSGTPLCLPSNIWNNGLNYYSQVLPGLTSITDILHENGYKQALMVGSDASFGGRKEYFSQHGVDTVYDLYTAREDGYVPSSDYYDGFWGFEDHYLFGYAQDKILAMSEGDEPFAFTMLTVDTHHPYGHFCISCDSHDSEGLSEREEKHAIFENVISCSDRQVAQFVEWLQVQDFYENTTVIITGDHYSMNAEFFQDKVPEDYVRRVYNCFINAPIEAENPKNREFTTLDMFPTALAAIGCNISGNRLGLGTNLFSAEKTLSEQLGMDYLNAEILKPSPYYESNFLYGSRKK